MSYHETLSANLQHAKVLFRILRSKVIKSNLNYPIRESYIIMALIFFFLSFLFFDSIIKRCSSVNGNLITDEIRGRHGYPHSGYLLQTPISD